VSLKEEDYSSYLAYESMTVQVLALLCGFTFTAITILVTQLPNLNQIISQVTLFFLAFMFYVFEFLLFFIMFYLSYCIQSVPPEARGRRTVGWLWFLSSTLWGIAIVLLFLLWNLTYLFLAAGVMYGVFTLLTIIFIWKPFLEFSKKLRPQK